MSEEGINNMHADMSALVNILNTWELIDLKLPITLKQTLVLAAISAVGASVETDATKVHAALEFLKRLT